MDFSFNDVENTIRSADKVFKGQLVEDDRNDFEKEIDEAMRISLEEAISLNDLNHDFEKEIIQMFKKRKIERKEIFDKFLLNLNRLIRFDKDVKVVYEIIEPIIDGYCNQLIDIYDFDGDTYDKIFEVLSTIRTDKKCVDILKTILIRV